VVVSAGAGVDCVTVRRYEDMTEHACRIYERGDLVYVLTVRVYYHRTRVTARVVARSELEAEAWRRFEVELSRRLSEVMPKPVEDRVVNKILEDYLAGLITA
jgi:hypothetical protein